MSHTSPEERKVLAGGESGASVIKFFCKTCNEEMYKPIDKLKLAILSSSIAAGIYYFREKIMWRLDGQEYLFYGFISICLIGAADQLYKYIKWFKS
tara:strand:- start:192 stop:479 length:288 start_codon:yes stop_codon:yes gene_type:complete